MNSTVLVSAAIGAVVAALVSGFFAWLTKRQELHVQRMNIALRCAELKHQQLVASQEWNLKAGKPPAEVDHWDPLMSIIGYMKGMSEFEKTGDWSKGRADIAAKYPGSKS